MAIAEWWGSHEVLTLLGRLSHNHVDSYIVVQALCSVCSPQCDCSPHVVPVDLFVSLATY